jgi:hypothetical protein
MKLVAECIQRDKTYVEVRMYELIYDCTDSEMRDLFFEASFQEWADGLIEFYENWSYNDVMPEPEPESE